MQHYTLPNQVQVQVIKSSNYIMFGNCWEMMVTTTRFMRKQFNNNTSFFHSNLRDGIKQTIDYSSTVDTSIQRFSGKIVPFNLCFRNSSHNKTFMQTYSEKWYLWYVKNVRGSTLIKQHERKCFPQTINLKRWHSSHKILHRKYVTDLNSFNSQLITLWRTLPFTLRVLSLPLHWNSHSIRITWKIMGQCPILVSCLGFLGKSCLAI